MFYYHSLSVLSLHNIGRICMTQKTVKATLQSEQFASCVWLGSVI